MFDIEMFGRDGGRKMLSQHLKLLLRLLLVKARPAHGRISGHLPQINHHLCKFKGRIHGINHRHPDNIDRIIFKIISEESRDERTSRNDDFSAILLLLRNGEL